MIFWQSILVFLFGLLSCIGWVQAYIHCKKRQDSYGYPPKVYGLYGSLVWADHIIFGGFWVLVSLLCLILNDFLLFLLFFSVFWLTRSFGETIYWFFQQFTPRKGNEPEKFFWYTIVKNDSVWFINQIYWQCVTVITIISTVYLFALWLPRHI